MNSQRASTRRIVVLELRSVDFLLVWFLLILSILEILFRSNIDGWESLVLKNIVAAALFAGALSMSGQLIASGPGRAAVRMLCIVLLTSFIYQEMGKVIHMIFPYWWDRSINSMEMSFFGTYPTVWFQAMTKSWLTEILMFAYVVYVPMVPGVALFCLYRGKQGEMERYLTELTAVYLLCDLFYVLVPVAGPSRTLQALHTVPLEGFLFTGLANYMIANVHLPGGAFPSAHCAAAVVMLAAVLRTHRVSGFAGFPLVLLIFVSTVYGRFHYVSDVCSGILVGVATLWIGLKLKTVFDRWSLHLEFTVGAAADVPVVAGDWKGEGHDFGTASS